MSYFQDTVTSNNVVVMYRYSEIRTIKITGIVEINDFLNDIMINRISKIEAILKKEGLGFDTRLKKIELIQINQTINSKDEVVAICLIGTIIDPNDDDLLHNILYRH